MDNILIVFARRPVLGKVKTRLALDIGEEKTLTIYKKLLDHTLGVTGMAAATTKIYWSESTGDNVAFVQKGKDLGERMYNALIAEFNGLNNLCLIGTDTPFITHQIINEAFEALNKNDIVFGPAMDGGYYLVALKSSPPQGLFIDKEWSHNNVLNDALEICKAHSLKVHLMPTLLDIDTLDDLNSWQNTKG